jgi:hypothetical protein
MFLSYFFLIRMNLDGRLTIKLPSAYQDNIRKQEQKVADESRESPVGA